MSLVNPNPMHQGINISEDNNETDNWMDHKEEFCEWYGMDEIIDDYKVAIAYDRNQKGGINGWAALAVIYGPEKIVTSLNTNIATIQIVCGLLLSFTYPLLVEPPDSIGSLSKNSNTLIAYGVLMSFSNIFFLLTIILGTIVELGLNSCGRTSDLYRMVLGIGWMPTFIYTMFTVSIFLMGLGFGLAMMPTYGNFVSANFAFILCGLCFGCNYISVAIVCPMGHIVHGWRNKIGGYDICIPFEKLVRSAKWSIQYKQFRAEKIVDEKTE